MTQRNLVIFERPAEVGAQAAPPATAATKGAVLHCDLTVNTARETELLQYFHEVFRPVAETFEGFRDLKILKLRTLIQGTAPAGAEAQYRFHLSYDSEALRQVWTNSPEHAALWPAIEDTLMDKGYLVVLYDEA